MGSESIKPGFIIRIIVGVGPSRHLPDDIFELNDGVAEKGFKMCFLEVKMKVKLKKKIGGRP